MFRFICTLLCALYSPCGPEDCFVLFARSCVLCTHYVALRTVLFYLHVAVCFLLIICPLELFCFICTLLCALYSLCGPEDCFVLFARCCVLFTHYLSPRIVLFYLHVTVCFLLNICPQGLFCFICTLLCALYSPCGPKDCFVLFARCCVLCTYYVAVMSVPFQCMLVCASCSLCGPDV